MDMEDLLAPAAYGDQDILGLLDGASLSDMLAGGSLGGRGDRHGGNTDVGQE